MFTVPTKPAAKLSSPTMNDKRGRLDSDKATKEKNKLVLEGVRADLQEQMKENESKRAIPSKLNNQ